VLTAAGFIVPAIAVGLALAADLLAGPRAALAYAVVVFGGWISLTIVGMMLKIVPFLVWYRAYSPRAGRERVPTLAQLSAPWLEGGAYVLLTAGFVLLAVAVFVGEVAWIRAAGAGLTLGAAAFVAALVRILAHLSGARLASGAGSPDRAARTPRPPTVVKPPESRTAAERA
jgi:hypothetical protein